MDDIFGKFYNEAVTANNRLTDLTKLRAVWVHPDGRCLGMTGVDQYVLDVVPREFVRDPCPLDELVDIYVPPSCRSREHPEYRPQAFEPPR